MNRAERRKQRHTPTASSVGASSIVADTPAGRLFKAAQAAHAAARIAEAEQLYTRCLELDPRHAEARHDLGVLMLGSNAAQKAAGHFERLLADYPAHAGAWLNLSLARGAGSDFTGALAAAQRAVALAPGLAAAQAVLAKAFGAVSAFEEAAAAYRAALALDRTAAPIRLQYAVLLRRMGDLVGARGVIEAYVTDHPRDPKGFAERAALFDRLDDHAAAEQDLRVAWQLDPSDTLPLRLLCTHLSTQGRSDEAMVEIDQAVARSPADPALRIERADLHRRCGALPSALADLQAAAVLDPADAQTFFRIGDVLYSGANYEAATAAFLEAVTLRPDFVEAYANLAVIRITLGDMTSALALLRHASALAPDRVPLAIDLCWARISCCDWQGLAEDFRMCLSRCIEAGEPFPPFSLLAFGLSPDEFLLWTRAWAERHAGASAKQLTAYSKRCETGGRRIRIGYLSADFKGHATATLITELLEAHDRERFESFGYNIGSLDQSPDGWRLIASLEHFDDLTLLDDASAAARIARDGLDILVDLKGYTRESRPRILAYRPAPIQVNYLGFPGSLGTPHIDYIIADEMVAPLEHRAAFDEAIVHLPHCYQPNGRDRPGADPSARRADHGLPEAGVVFCCFNTNYKITPLIFDIWMRLLHDTPGSVLWLLHSNAESVGNLRREAQERGIDGTTRIIFAPRVSVSEHIGRLGLADLFLDTLPVNAHTTASEALWAGVPVLTCLGPDFVGRVAASLLTTLGVPELIRPDLDSYEREARALAADPQRLARLRERIAANRMTSPLFDPLRYARNYEAALDTMVQRRRDGELPACFAIADHGPQAPRTVGPPPTSQLFSLATPSNRMSSDRLFAELDALVDRRTAG